MDRRTALIFMSMLLLVSSLLWGFDRAYAESDDIDQAQDTTLQQQDAAQPQDAVQPQKGYQFPCDGTGQGGSVPGLRRSTSNCDREAAAARNAARRAAAGQTSPASAAPAPEQGGQQ